MSTNALVATKSNNSSFGGFKCGELEVYYAQSNGVKSLLSIDTTNKRKSKCLILENQKPIPGML